MTTKHHPLIAALAGVVTTVWAIAKPGLLQHYPQASGLILGMDGLLATFIVGQQVAAKSGDAK